jgi:hypothetical protein
MPLSTVGAVLARHGLGKLPRPQPEQPATSYERPRPGKLVHIDVKKLGKIERPGHRVNADRRTTDSDHTAYSAASHRSPGSPRRTTLPKTNS